MGYYTTTGKDGEEITYFVQEYFILKANKVAQFQKQKVTNWFEIDPVELKNGDFALPEQVLTELEAFATKEKPTQEEKDKATTLADALKLDKAEFRAIADDEWIDDTQI